MHRRNGRLRRLTTLCLTAGVAWACLVLGTPTQLSAQTDDAEAIKSALIDMWDAIEQGDLERYASHIHDDFTSFGENDPYLNEGKDYELHSVAGWMEGSPGVHTEMHEPQVTVRGSTAWITYYWTDAVTDESGNESTSAGKSTRIFVKENGRWLCIHGHYTLRP